jgi:hypothetical protein
MLPEYPAIHFYALKRKNTVLAAQIFAKRAIVRRFSSISYVIEFHIKTLKFLTKFRKENGALIIA